MSRHLKIGLVSGSWPFFEHAGVALASDHHAHVLEALGHKVVRIGPVHTMVTEKNFAYAGIHYSGTGSLYAPLKLKTEVFEKMLSDLDLDLVICESWQNGISEAAISAAQKINVPVVMVSHGLSVHLFSFKIIDILRLFGWLYYRFFIFPSIIKKIKCLTCLDMDAISKRFADRELANKFAVPTLHLPNTAINFDGRFINRHNRVSQILVIGYFSHVKNQIGALRILKKLPKCYTMKFVGECSGSYFEKFKHEVKRLNLSDRVLFGDDKLFNLCDEISRSIIVLNTSKTECQPVSLIESMAFGTPFVAPKIGAIPSMKGGVVYSNPSEAVAAILDLLIDVSMWNKFSSAGRVDYARNYSRSVISEKLRAVLWYATE